MKKFFTILLLSSAIIGYSQEVNSNAVVRDILFEEASWQSFIPGIFTTNGKGQCCLLSGDIEQASYYDGGVEINVYDDTFRKIRTFSCSSDVEGMNYIDTNSGHDGYYISFTQTLFNSDDEYEFFVPLKTTIIGSGWSLDVAIGYRILSTNGEELFRIEFDDGLYVREWGSLRLLRMGDNYFLSLQLSKSGDEEDYVVIYAIDKTTSSVKQVIKQKVMSIAPTIVRPSECVNISVKTAMQECTMSVFSTDGGLVKQVKLQAWQANATLDTAGLPTGMYIVNISDGVRTYENSRFIVR